MGSFDYGDKVRSLLAMADDERLTDNARQAYRDKAEELMAKYHVELTEAIAKGTADAPIQHTMTLFEGQTMLTNWYRIAFRSIAEHCGVKVHFFYGDNALRATVVGFEGDVRYADFLWTGTYLMFSTRIDPRWDDNVSWEENIWRFRNAGIKRKEIAFRAGLDGNKAADRSKVQRVYLAECKRREVAATASGLGHNADTYQESYASSFVMTLQDRLRMARDAADSVRGAVTLSGRDDKVSAAFWEAFPQYRPQPAADTTGNVTWVDPREGCPKCAKAKTTCRDHAYLRPRTWTQADQARYDSRYKSTSARAGSAAGVRAAEGVVIARGHTAAKRLDESGRAIEG